MADTPFKGVDLMVKRNADGVYDLVIENGEFKTVNSFDTALEMVIHCERRADSSEITIPEFRRGWVGNAWLSDTGFEIGSKFWLLFQERRTEDVLNRAINYLQQGYQWLVDDGHLQELQVTGKFIKNDGIQINVKYVTLDNVTESKYYELWKNTGIYNLSDTKRNYGNLRIEYLELDPNQATPTYVTRVGGKLMNDDGTELLLDSRTTQNIIKPPLKQEGGLNFSDSDNSMYVPLII